MCKGTVHSWVLRLPRDVQALVDGFVPPRLGRACDACTASVLLDHMEVSEEWDIEAPGPLLTHWEYCPMDYVFRVDKYRIVLQTESSMRCIGKVRDSFWARDLFVDVEYRCSEVEGEPVPPPWGIEPYAWPAFE